jgi:hypothetical protein
MKPGKAIDRWNESCNRSSFRKEGSHIQRSQVGSFSFGGRAVRGVLDSPAGDPASKKGRHEESRIAGKRPASEQAQRPSLVFSE